MPRRTRRYWLMKSEPDVFSYDDLERAKDRTTPWDGVRNYRARNFMRDEMAVGDGVLYYHSNADPPGVAGIAEVASEAYPDPTQFDLADGHFDPKSKESDPRWFLVDVQAVRKLPRFVSLADLKADPRLAEMGVVQRGNRLSVQPVEADEWRVVLELGGARRGTGSRRS
jgi:predicted RNA-binding protein with PUA-like domain